MARLGARIRKDTMETMKTLGTAAVARSPMSPGTNISKVSCVPGVLQPPTVGQGLKTTNGNMVRLGDVATYINGYAFKPADWSTEGVLIIRIQDLTGNSYKANRFKGKIDKRYEVLNGDVLISWSASLGVYVWSGEKAVLNQHIFKVQFDKTQVNKSFFVHQVECILKRAIGEAHGATMKHLTKPAFDALPFYLPDIQKQKAIADSLDKISHLITLRKQQLSKLDELVKSQFVEMFGDVVANDRRWPMAKFGDVTDSRLGKMLDAKKQTGRNTHKYLANFNVQWFRIDDSELHEMDFDAADQIEFELKEGDLLVCEGGESGRCCVWRGQIRDCYYQKALHRVRCNPERLNPDFLAYWFWMNCHHGAFEHIIGAKATIAHLPGVKLKKLDVILPPLALQREFAAFVAKVDKLAFKAKASLEKLETLKKAMMQKYFN